MLDLKEFAAIAGKPGLYRILKPARAGVIIESLEANPQRSTANATSKVSLLKEITIYTNNAEGATSLQEVMKTIYSHYPTGTTVTNKSDASELMAFFGEVLPDFDRERVYASDIKKIANWYNLLLNFAPAVFEEKSEEVIAEAPATEATENHAVETSPVAAEPTEEVVAEAKPKKATKKAKAE
jgi:hypothetical protein